MNIFSPSALCYLKSSICLPHVSIRLYQLLESPKQCALVVPNVPQAVRNLSFSLQYASHKGLSSFWHREQWSSLKQATFSLQVSLSLSRIYKVTMFLAGNILRSIALTMSCYLLFFFFLCFKLSSLLVKKGLSSRLHVFTLTLTQLCFSDLQFI